ncbi:importin subunit beta [Vairimorpha necatrix]|uniref:Importin subunit beta n=1 Tax=Vairimorpha necatrix TaxID=6039 RepID=A0AAX4JE26_9MICR
MERKDIEQCLYNALQPDDSIRREAELKITDLQSKNYCFFLQNITNIFIDPNTPVQLKMIAGIILKNSLHSSDSKIQGIYEQKWCEMAHETREIMKNLLTNIFADQNEKIYNLAGSAIGYIARIELNNNLSFDFFNKMEQQVTEEAKSPAVFEAVSTCCVTLSDETNFNFDQFIENIFNICTMKLELKQSSVIVKETSLKCLMNCFKTISTIFKNENFILKFLNCIAITASTDPKLIYKSLICLNRFVFLNHQIISDKIPDIINYINNFWNFPSDNVSVQVVEFWTILAEIKGIDYIEKNLDFLLPNILRLMKKNEDYNDQSWNAHKASAYFLETISEIYGCEIFFNNTVFKFIEGELNSEDKKRIDIGAITLGSVITKECDQQLVNFIKILIFYMRDLEIQESCLWALAKICETNFLAVVEHLTSLLQQACEIIILKESSATTAAWILNSIFISLQNLKVKKVYSGRFPIETQMALRDYAIKQMKEYYTEILKILISATENVALENSTLRVALFSAMAEQIRLGDSEYSEMLDNVLVYCQNKICECAAAINKASANYVPIIEDVLSNYIILSECVAAKRKKDSSLILLPSYISVLKSRFSSAIGEVYIAVTSNILDFSNNLEDFVPFIIRDLACLDSFILKSTINLVGCMANSIPQNFFHLSTQFIPLLVQNLSSKQVAKEVKTQILSVFGDIAMSLEINFEQYLEMSMMIFIQILSLERSNDPEYVDDLRYNVVQMFNCIVLATCESNKLREILFKLVEGIRKLLADENSDETLIAIINLIKDLQSIFGGNYDLEGRWIEEFYNKCMKSKNPELRIAVEKIKN